jgi:hypothetical protein
MVTVSWYRTVKHSGGWGNGRFAVSFATDWRETVPLET